MCIENLRQFRENNKVETIKYDNIDANNKIMKEKAEKYLMKTQKLDIQSGGGKYDTFTIRANLKRGSVGYHTMTARHNLFLGNYKPIYEYKPNITLYTAYLLSHSNMVQNMALNMDLILTHLEEIKNITFIPKRVRNESSYSILEKPDKNINYVVRDFYLNDYDGMLYDNFLSHMNDMIRQITKVNLTPMWHLGYLYNGYAKIPIHMSPRNANPHITLLSSYDVLDSATSNPPPILYTYKLLHDKIVTIHNNKLNQNYVSIPHFTTNNLDDYGIIHRTFSIAKYRAPNKYLQIILGTLQANPAIEHWLNIPIPNINILYDTYIGIYTDLGGSGHLLKLY